MAAARRTLPLNPAESLWRWSVAWFRQMGTPAHPRVHAFNCQPPTPSKVRQVETLKAPSDVSAPPTTFHYNADYVSNVLDFATVDDRWRP